jgi:hypothetical protein
MNMISTGTFQTEMDASNKQSSLVKKLVSAWEKKNAKVARAGGVSLMALSLAACSSDDDDAAVVATPTTPATTTTVTPVTPVAASLALTSQTDDLSGAGDFDAGMVWSPGGDTRVNSLQSEDRVEGTGAADSITISSNGGDMAPKFTGVETVSVTLSGATATTLNLSNSTGVTTVNLSSTDGDVGVTGLASTVAAKAFDVADAATNVFFNVKASALTATSDSMSVTVDGFSGTNLNVGSAAAAGVAGGGIETLNLIASGELSSIASLGSGAATINVDADAQLTVSAFSATGITTLNAGESSGTVSFNVGANISANVFAYTGSAGADTLIATSGFAGTDSIAGGEGADTFSIRPAGGAADITAAGALNASSVAVFSGFETLDMRSAAGNAVDFTVDMDTMPGITAINLRTANTDAGGATFTLNDLSAAQAGAITVLHTGTDADTDSEVIVDMKTDTAADTVTMTATTSLAGQVVQVNDAGNNIENLVLTVNGDMNNTVDLDDASFQTSIKITGGGAARTMTIFGDSTAADGFDAASIDLSGVLSNTTLELEGAEQTFKGGSGRDTLTVLGTLSAGDVLDGGVGATDTLSMNNASVTAVNALSATLASTLSSNITGFERISISDALNQGLNMADFGTSSNRLILANDFTGPETVSNLNNGSTIVTSSTPNATGDILTLNTVGAATGTADTITIIVDGSAAIDYGQFALSGYETITVNATEATANAALRVGSMALNVTQAGGAQSTVNFTGTESVTLTEALDAQIVSATALGGAFIMGASSTAGSQTITGGAGADTLVGSSSGDTITGGAGVDIITGNAGNDVINGGAGADEISADAGINIVTGGAGSDDVHLTTATTGIAVQLTTVTDFNAGTSTTGVDQVEFDLSEMNLANGDLNGAIDALVTGLGADNGGSNSSNLATGNAVLTTQRITGDGQQGVAATELFLIDNGVTYQDDDAFETALAAGQVTVTTGAVDNNDGVMIAYSSTAGHVNVGIGQFNLGTGNFDTIDGFQTLVVLENVSMSNLDSSDFLIVA